MGGACWSYGREGIHRLIQGGPTASSPNSMSDTKSRIVEFLDNATAVVGAVGRQGDSCGMHNRKATGSTLL